MKTRMPSGATERVRVAVPRHPYDVLIANRLLQHAGSHLRRVLRDQRRLFVVTAPSVRKRWGKELSVSLRVSGFEATFVAMPDGERYKKLATVEALAEKLARLGAERGAVIVAFGGGVVGDTAGMLASIYMRGVDFVQVPTTLLAQVDAAIGGKTGVNLRMGKNLLGVFHQPRIVLIDPSVLSTLTSRQFRAGLYECLKCGVIGNRRLFERLEKIRPEELHANARELQCVIAESVGLKAKIVAADERESGLRRVLNFGHTIGHALEAESHYGRFLHGEAVAWGMVAAARIANLLGSLSRGDCERIANAVLGLGPLPRITANVNAVLRLLQADKKTRNAVVHFVLPTRIGRVEVVQDVPAKVILRSLDEVKRFAGKLGAAFNEGGSRD